MTFVNQIDFKTPVLRVNDKDANIAFYEQHLGLRLVSEENALAFFEAWENTEATFTIEESPTYRTRAVEGVKKLNRLVFKASKPEDIAQLLARDITVQTVFEGTKGYAFETVSPEGDRILLHAEDDVTTLSEIARPSLVADAAFKGLSDFVISEVGINVPDVAVANAFYQNLFEGESPIQLSFVEAQGPDLQVEPNGVWDLEILSFKTAADTDLAALKNRLETKGHSVYLDKKETILVVSDTSRIEVWFEK